MDEVRPGAAAGAPENTAESGAEDTRRAVGLAQLEISNGLVRAHKELHGRGPEKARTHISGDLVVCVLEGGFHASERTLQSHGRGDVVDSQREALQTVLADRFISIVEQALNRRVRSFMSANDAANELQAEVFVLEPRDRLGDLRRASQEARRRNAEVLGEHRALRAEQVQARRHGRNPDSAA